MNGANPTPIEYINTSTSTTNTGVDASVNETDAVGASARTVVEAGGGGAANALEKAGNAASQVCSAGMIDTDVYCMICTYVCLFVYVSVYMYMHTHAYMLHLLR